MSDAVHNITTEAPITLVTLEKIPLLKPSFSSTPLVRSAMVKSWYWTLRSRRPLHPCILPKMSHRGAKTLSTPSVRLPMCLPAASLSTLAPGSGKAQRKAVVCARFLAPYASSGTLRRGAVACAPTIPCGSAATHRPPQCPVVGRIGPSGNTPIKPKFQASVVASIAPTSTVSIKI